MLVLDWHDPVALSRAWCLFELLITLGRGACLTVMLAREDEEEPPSTTLQPPTLPARAEEPEPEDKEDVTATSTGATAKTVGLAEMPPQDVKATAAAAAMTTGAGTTMALRGRRAARDPCRVHLTGTFAPVLGAAEEGSVSTQTSSESETSGDEDLGAPGVRARGGLAATGVATGTSLARSTHARSRTEEPSRSRRPKSRRPKLRGDAKLLAALIESRVRASAPALMLAVSACSLLPATLSGSYAAFTAAVLLYTVPASAALGAAILCTPSDGPVRNAQAATASLETPATDDASSASMAPRSHRDSIQREVSRRRRVKRKVRTTPGTAIRSPNNPCWCL